MSDLALIALWAYVGFVVLFALGLLVWLLWDAARDRWDDRDRRRLVDAAAIRERMAGGVAFVEALRLQLEEIWALPTAQVEADPSKRRRA